MFASIMTARPLVESGQLRALAVTSKTRSPFMPDVPAVAEYPGLGEFRGRSLVRVAGAGEHRPGHRRKLYQSTVWRFQDPSVKARFEPTGTVLVGELAGGIRAIIKSDLDEVGASDQGRRT